MPQAKFQINNYNKFKLTAILSFAALFLSGVYFVQPFASDNSYAETHTDSASGVYNGTTYSMTTTVSDLNLELYNVTPAGKATYGKQTVNVTTNAPGGYQLYVQTSGNLAGTKEGTATSDSIAALPSNNAALDMNTWGYTKTTPNEDANTAADQTIWNTPPSTITQVDATSSAAASGRDTDIYYGIKADNTLSGDNYSGTITYTTVASAASDTDLLVTRNGSGYAGENNNTLTITTPLMTMAALTTSDVSVTITNSSSTSYTCTVSSVSTSTGVLVVNCSIPTTATASTYSVSVSVSKYGKTYTKSSAFTLSTFTLSISSATPTTTTASTSTSMTITINRSSPSSTTAQYGSTSLSSKSSSGTTITGTISLSAGTYTLTVTATWNGKTYTATKSSAFTVKAGDMSSATYMQDVTQAMCANSTPYSTGSKQYTLKDKRDNNSYTIRKLADGNCWMVQNLRLINKTISSSDSDTSGSFTIPASSTSTGTTAGTWGTANDTNGINHTAARYNNNTTYGAYYNWYTATAGSGTYSTVGVTSVNYSICPKGWKLPTGGSSGQFKTLYTAYSSNVSSFQTATLTGSGYWAGYVDNGSLNNAGSEGYWWSRTAGSNTAHGYDLITYSGYVGPQGNNTKRRGLTVRCVLSSS